MGLFKGIKDLKGMLGAAPGLLDQANQLTANARAIQENAAAAQADSQRGSSPLESMPANLAEPIAGVDLATFAQVSAGLAQYNYDQSKATLLASSRGIDAASWAIAMSGWNQRIAAYPVVARQFNSLYTGRI